MADASYTAYPGSFPANLPSTLRAALNRPPPAPNRSPPAVPLPSLRGFDEGPNDAQSYDGPLSIGGIEPALPAESDSYRSRASNMSDELPVTPSGEDRHQVHKKGLEVISYIKEKSSYAEDASQIIQRLKISADRKLRRTYINGHPIGDFHENAPTIKVGIVFLPGVDRPTVTQLEQDMLMADYKPEQLSAAWRVNTAGHLLLDFEVTKDLRVIDSDTTPAVLEKLKRRKDTQWPYFAPGQKTEALAVTGKRRVPPSVNIDSEHVTLVSDLRYYSGQFDLESTLVEVDYSSMAGLLVNYRTIIQERNAPQDLDETRKLLEAMMEDVRRLCNRSAALFRMSTRTKIITAKDIRYGVNNGREFTTLTTSKGIRKIISLSSAYYTSLDTADKIQQLLKPRFLQMLVLLLSLLNEDDLRNIQEFVETTFHFKADRKNLELLFLKVIPFYSINSKVFLTSMVNAFEGQVRKPDNQEHQHFWEIFISRIAAMGYVLPGTIDGLGRTPKSWILEWPSQGFKSSLAFQNLQYCTSGAMRTFNDIPPIEKDFDRHSDTTLLTAVLTNNSQYLIRVADYEAILCLTKGIFSIQESDFSGRRNDLIIEESPLNEAAYRAIDGLNGVIKRVNHWLTSSRGASNRRRDSLLRGMKVPGRRPDVEMIAELRVTGKLTRYRAMLSSAPLAIAYKLDGRKITLEDALATLSHDNQTVQSVIDYYQGRLQQYSSSFAPETLQRITDTLNSVTNELSLANDVRQSISADPSISDEPIVTLIEPADGAFYSVPIWNDHHITVTAGNMLSVDAKKSHVTSVSWNSDQEVVITLHNDASQYFLTPLEYVEAKDREDQVREEDVAVLVGHYMIFAEPVENEGSNALIMSNYLKILRIEQGTKISKRQQRRMQTMPMSQALFV